MHGLMIASGMSCFCPTPACKIKESLIKLKRVTNSKTGELEESYILSDFYLSREFTDGELRLLIVQPVPGAGEKARLYVFRRQLPGGVPGLSGDDRQCNRSVRQGCGVF